MSTRHLRFDMLKTDHLSSKCVPPLACKNEHSFWLCSRDWGECWQVFLIRRKKIKIQKGHLGIWNRKLQSKNCQQYHTLINVCPHIVWKQCVILEFKSIYLATGVKPSSMVTIHPSFPERVPTYCCWSNSLSSFISISNVLFLIKYY